MTQQDAHTTERNHCCHCLPGCDEITGGHDRPCERCARGSHCRARLAASVTWQSFALFATAHAFEVNAPRSLCGAVVHAKHGFAPAPIGPWCRRCERAVIS